MQNEKAIQDQIRMEAARLGIHLWRNNSGVLQDERGVPVRFGLGNDSARLNMVLKSADLIGIMPDGRFIAVECKASNWKGVHNPTERAQETFLKLIVSRGGIAGFCRSVEEFKRLIGHV